MVKITDLVQIDNKGPADQLKQEADICSSIVNNKEEAGSGYLLLASLIIIIIIWSNSCTVIMTSNLLVY